MRWRGLFSLTQMVILHFLDIRTVGIGMDARENIVFRIGNSSEDIVLSMSAFTHRRTAADSLQQVGSLINGHQITQAKQIHSLIGKSVFISRKITTINIHGGYCSALAMHRLKGKLSEDAAIIRVAIIDSKIEMLDRLLAYPHTNIYLNGEPSQPADIATPINRIKALIATYSTVIPHAIEPQTVLAHPTCRV